MTKALIVVFDIHPGREAAFADAIARNARASVAGEPGCRQFDVCRDPENPALFFLYELYDDDAAIAAHMASPHFLSFDALTRDWVAGKTVRRYERSVP